MSRTAPRPGRASGAAPHPGDRLGRGLSLTDATLLAVSSVIGSGIFLTPGRVADLLPVPGLILVAWLVGGLLSLAGALANAELGAMYPRAGGDYVYLRQAFHPAAGFLVGWLTFLAIYAGTVAVLALGFARTLTTFVDLGESQIVFVAILLTVGVSAINYFGVRLGAILNNLSALAKVAALAGFIVLAFSFQGEGMPSAPAAPRADMPLVAAFGLALSPILFSYLGWNAPVYVASEIRDPGRNVPGSLFLGLAICTAIYLAINTVYLQAVPMAQLRTEVNVGEVAAAAVLGPRAGTIFAAFILLSIFGTLNAMVLVGPRIAYAMALDGLFFRGAERVHPSYETPHFAIVAQAVVAVVLLLVLETFPRLLDFTTFAIVLATIADTAALYVLRRTQPDRPRPYRAWGYPAVPAIYLIANFAIALILLWGRPFECAIALGVLASGLPFYWWFTQESGRTLR